MSLNIDFWVPGDPRTNSGGYEYDRHLAEELTQQGHRVRFVQPHKKDSLTTAADLILADELGHSAYASLIRGLRGHGPPVVAVVHHLRGRERRSPLFNRLILARERSFLSRVDAAICNSQATKKDVERLLGTRPVPPATVLRPGLDPAHRERSSTKANAVQILSVGAVTRHKGYLRVARALESCGDLEWKWVIVGDTTFEPDTVRRIQRWTSRNRWRDRVEITGWIDSTRLDALWRESQIFVLPAGYEGFGMAALQATARGIPVIAGSLGGISEVVVPGMTGILVNDHRELVQAVRQLLLDSEQRERMSREALRRAQGYPNWEQAFQAAGSFLESVCLSYRRSH